MPSEVGREMRVTSAMRVLLRADAFRFIRKLVSSQAFDLPHGSRAAAWLLLAAAVTLPSGCVHDRVKFEPDLLNTPGYMLSHKIEGKALILTDALDDQRVNSYAPRNHGFGAWSRLELPMGRIVGESATSAFGELFADGADWLNPPVTKGNYTAVVCPHLITFSYRFTNTFSQPVVEVMETSVSISILDNADKVIWEHSYQSGPFQGDAFEPSRDDVAKSVGPVIQRKLHELMVRAALDFADSQFQQHSPLQPVKPQSAK